MRVQLHWEQEPRDEERFDKNDLFFNPLCEVCSLIFSGGVSPSEVTRPKCVLGFSVFLHASLIDFNTPDAAVKARFSDVITFPSFLYSLAHTRTRLTQFLWTVKKKKQTNKQTRRSKLQLWDWHAASWNSLESENKIVSRTLVCAGIRRAVSIMYSFWAKGITNIFLDILCVYCIS